MNTTEEHIDDGVREQIKKREWEEDDRNWIGYIDANGEYWDEVSGEKLDKEGVIRARKEEMEELCKHEVYEKVPIKECWEMTGKAPIGTKWVEINKGDSFIRSIAVGW